MTIECYKSKYKLPEPALPNPGGFQDLYTADQLREEVAEAERRGREAMLGLVRKVHAGYTEDELERDNPHNQWMHE